MNDVRLLIWPAFSFFFYFHLKERILVAAYPVTSFGGEKKVILSNTSWLGGRNPMMGITYIVIGAIHISLGIVFLVIHIQTKKRWVALEVSLLSDLASSFQFGSVSHWKPLVCWKDLCSFRTPLFFHHHHCLAIWSFVILLVREEEFLFQTLLNFSFVI